MFRIVKGLFLVLKTGKHIIWKKKECEASLSWTWYTNTFKFFFPIKKHIYKEFSGKARAPYNWLWKPQGRPVTFWPLLPSCYLLLPSLPFLLSSVSYFCKVASWLCPSTVCLYFPSRGKGLVVTFGQFEVSVCLHSGQDDLGGVGWELPERNGRKHLYIISPMANIDFDSIPKPFSNLKVFSMETDSVFWFLQLWLYGI